MFYLYLDKKKSYFITNKNRIKCKTLQLPSQPPQRLYTSMECSPTRTPSASNTSLTRPGSTTGSETCRSQVKSQRSLPKPLSQLRVQTVTVIRLQKALVTLRPLIPLRPLNPLRALRAQAGRPRSQYLKNLWSLRGSRSML